MEKDQDISTDLTSCV